MGTDDPTLPSKPGSKTTQRLSLASIVTEQLCSVAGIADEDTERREQILEIVQKLYASGVAAGREDGSGSHARWRGVPKEVTESFLERHDWMASAHGLLIETYGGWWFAASDEVIHSEDRECLVKYRLMHFGKEPHDRLGVGQECYSIEDVSSITRTPHGIVIVASDPSSLALFLSDKELPPLGV